MTGENPARPVGRAPGSLIESQVHLLALRWHRVQVVTACAWRPGHLLKHFCSFKIPPSVWAVATPDYNQGNERREATSPRELKRASALKEKGVPKATTQDSCFSHMIRTGQSLRVQPVEAEPAWAGQPAWDSQPGTAPAAPGHMGLTQHRGAAPGPSESNEEKDEDSWKCLF